MNKTIAILILGTAVSLSAQSVRFGVQGALSLPDNDLSDNADLGIQAGGHARFDLGRGHGVMARADLASYSQNNSTHVTNLAIAADYTYHFEQRQRGIYVLGGIAQQNYHTSFPGDSRNDSGLGFDLGAANCLMVVCLGKIDLYFDIFAPGIPSCICGVILGRT